MTYLMTSTEKPSTFGFCHSGQAFTAASLRTAGKGGEDAICLAAALALSHERVVSKAIALDNSSTSYDQSMIQQADYANPD
ncbi:MAG: hypothetical protein Fur006_15070 [Coleofasciculaceae cyanobacterium]